jgi:hypothetical protein
VAECGAGKTFMSLGTAHTLAAGRPYSVITMCPPHIVHKWAREALLTIPNARTFIIEDLRNGGDPTLATSQETELGNRKVNGLGARRTMSGVDARGNRSRQNMRSARYQRCALFNSQST